MSRIGVRRKLTLVSAALLLAVVGVLIFAPVASAQGIGLGQGQMAGEVTTGSVILQSRLTVNGDPLIGTPGVGRFEISTTPGFAASFLTDWVTAESGNDFIIKVKVTGLNPGTRYYYRLLYGPDETSLETGSTCTFRTLDSPDVARETSFIVVTGMNYFPFRFLSDLPDKEKELGYPALETMLLMNPDFVVATGDNVYYDAWPVPGETQAELRENWHLQFVQPRFLSLFSQVPFYWEKDDHDFRYNDADPHCDQPPSAELGIQTFLEQVPVVDPNEANPVTYRTYRINKLVQIWLLEGRDYRSPNIDPDGPAKTIWGETQKQWLKDTLLASDATFKFLISPTPMIGPDDVIIPPGAQLRTHCQDDIKRDNHTNPEGFKYEGEAFFTWLAENGFLAQNFYIITGDRHWKYHSIRPDGFEEFSSGALCDINSRLGMAPGDPDGTDPLGLINQPFTDPEASGGFLRVTVKPGDGGSPDTGEFTFYDENGVQLHPAPPAVPAATGTGMVTFSTMSGTIENLTAVPESSLPSAGKPNLQFPHGFFSFDISGLSIGETVVVTIELPSAVPVGTQYWKYHASEGGWIQIPMGSDNGDNVITITLIDGGLGDDDLTANGVIIDQGGPGNPLGPTEPGEEGGCFIATAAYGSYLDSHVETLRDFRDQYLVTNPVGSALVSVYYDISPPMARFIDDHPALKPIVRVGLLPAVAMSTVAVNTTSAQKIAMVSGLALVSLALGMWLRRRAVRKMTY